MIKTVAIINPNSALGATGNRLQELTDLLRHHFGPCELRLTNAIGHAIELARAAADDHADRIIVAGGDGTSGEVVSGLLQSDRGRDVQLGLLPTGTGGDFSRAIWGKRDMQSAIQRIASGHSRMIDAARVQYHDRDGQLQNRGFLNILSCGMSGFAALWIETQALRGRRGRTTYIRSGLHGILRYPQNPVTITVDGRQVYQGPLAFVALANGRYFGGGMKVAPDAQIDDGLLDVVIVPGASRLKLVFRFPRIRTGAHVRSDDAISLRGRHISVSGDVWIESDGEPIGMTPAEIEVAPAAIQLCDGSSDGLKLD